MITDIFLIIIAIPLGVILSVLSAISSVFTSIIPDQVYTSISTLFGYLGYFNSIYPIDTLAACILAISTFYTVLYIVKIALWAWGLVPWLGSTGANNLPTISDREWQSQLDDDQVRRWRNHVKRKGGKT